MTLRTAADYLHAHPDQPLLAFNNALRLSDKALVPLEVASHFSCGLERRTIRSDKFAVSPGFTPLLLTAQTSRIDVLFALMTAGANLKALDDRGYSALHIALDFSSIRMAELLVRYGADIGVRSYLGRSNVGNYPLHLAIRSRHLAAVGLLICNGADLDCKAYGNTTPLHLAVRDGFFEAAELLAAEGACLTAKDTDGNTPLHLACMGSMCPRPVYTILAGGQHSTSAVHAVNNIGRTPLHVAAAKGAAIAILALTDLKASVSALDGDGATPISLFYPVGLSNMRSSSGLQTLLKRLQSEPTDTVNC